jgi:AcrR family transcriptional regulator
VTGGDPQPQPRRGSGTAGAERERVVVAFGRAASECGYARLRMEDVARCAAMPAVAVEAHFASLDEGLAAAQEAFLDRLWRDAVAACEEQEEWPQRVRAALGAVLDSLGEGSAVARAFAVEATAASLAAANRQLATLERFAAMLAAGRRHHPAATELPTLTERLLVGGVASIVFSRLLAEEAMALPGLGPELVELVLLPYLGEAAARRVARA